MGNRNGLVVPVIVPLDENMSNAVFRTGHVTYRGNGCQIYMGYTHWYGSPMKGNGWGSGCGYTVLPGRQFAADCEDWFYSLAATSHPTAAEVTPVKTSVAPLVWSIKRQRLSRTRRGSRRTGGSSP